MDKKSYQDPMLDISLFSEETTSDVSGGGIVLPDHEW